MMVADGDIGDPEIGWLDRLPVHEPLGLARRELLRLRIELAQADAQVDESESIVLVAAVAHWGLHHEMVRSPSQAFSLGRARRSPKAAR